jgi:amidase
VPVTIKDAFETAGIVSTGGTLGRKGFVPAEDATVVRRLRGAGAIVLGKTNLPELSLAWESDNLVYGRTNNPYNLERTPGGSSGGEAAIIAAGGSPLGVGSDSGGSIRLPSHFSGIAGIKPTTGRVPLTGHFPPAMGVTAPLWQAGPMARRVEDLVTALPILAGPDGRDPHTAPAPLGDPAAVDVTQLRVAFHVDNGVMAADADTAAAVRTGARVLADAGATVEERRPEGIEEAFDLMMGLFAFDAGEGIERFLARIGTHQVHRLVTEFIDILRPYAMSSVDFGGLLERLDLWRGRMLRFFESCDLILCPACARPAMPHGGTWGEQLRAFNYTEVHNLTGWPGAVVRAGTSADGLPIGVQAVAPPWREDVALAAALEIERVLGGWQRPPI